MNIRYLGPARDGMVAVGRVVKAHGARGEVKIFPFSGNPDDFKQYQQLLLVSGQGERSERFQLLASRSHGRLAVCALAGIEDRDQASAYREFEVRVAGEELPRLKAGDWYWHQLQGLPVRTVAGRRLGVAADLLATGGHDVLVVAGAGGREYLLPAREEFIAAIDPVAGFAVTPVPGLLELYE